VVGDGLQPSDAVYVKDIIQALSRVLFDDRAIGLCV
jgi:hypothetical protein